MVGMPDGAQKQYYLHEQCVADTLKIARAIQAGGREFTHIYGLSRGGLWLAVRLSHLLELDLVLKTYHSVHDNELFFIGSRGEIIPKKKVVVVDDIADSGAQLQKFRDAGCFIATLFYHKDSTVVPDIWKQEKIGERKKVWIIFETWEADPL